MKSDVKLVMRAQQGEAGAFDLLMREHYPFVQRAFRRVTPVADDVDDLVQETFITAYVHLDQLVEPAQFAGWLATIARRIGLMWQRRRYVQPTLLPLEDELQEVTSGLAAASTRAARQMAQSELMRSSVADALAKLTAAQRQAVLLHYLEGYDYRETATLLDVPETVIRGRLYRARTALRKELSTMMTLAEQGIVLTARDLAALRHAASFSDVGADARIVLNTVFFTGAGQLVSTDSHRLFVYESPTLKEMPKLLLHADAARTLRDQYANASQAKMLLAEEECVLALQEGGRIPLHVLDETFPTWERIVPTDFQQRVTARYADWSTEIDALIRLHESGILSMTQENDIPRVEMSFAPGDSTISLSAFQLAGSSGEVTRAFTVSFPGTYAAECGQLSITANLYYVWDALHALCVDDDAPVELCANSWLDPFVFRALTPGDVRVITMPMHPVRKDGTPAAGSVEASRNS